MDSKVQDNKVEWIDDYDLLKTFHSKKVKIANKYDSTQELIMHLPTVGEYYDNENYITAVQLFKTPLKDIQENFSLWKIDSYYDFFILICFIMNGVKEFNFSHECIVEFIKLIFPEEDNDVLFSYADSSIGLHINGVFINATLWDYIWYIIWRSFEEKEKSQKPKVFTSALEKEFFEKQKMAEERIRAIKQQNNKGNVDEDQLLKTFITIMYALPQITFDFLFSCTYAGISWLYEYAMKICNYNIEVQALTAGHLKKKFKFFTEK